MRLFELNEGDGEKRDDRGYVVDVEKRTTDNDNYREVLFTTDNTQLVLMSIKPGDQIGEETHKGSQFIRIESGNGKITINEVEYDVEDGSAAVVPGGLKHNVINTSENKSLKLYALYSPPVHGHDVVHKTKKDENHVKEDIKHLYKPNEADKQATEMGLPNQYKNKDWGSEKPRKEKVIVRDTKTGKVYGQRTIFQKRT